MIKRLKNITNNIYPMLLIVVILIAWLLMSELGVIPKFMLPSPIDVVKTLFSEASILYEHLLITLQEAFLGLFISVTFAFIMAVLMDRYYRLYQMVYPLFVISQTIPVIAIAPLLVLWMGYGIAPKVFLIFLVCFFPLVISLLDGFKSVDKDILRLMKSMNASEIQILTHVKIPCAMRSFFAGLKVSVAYCIVGAVIAEWLGGTSGLGVYMTRVRKSYSYDKMFAVIFVISALSLILMWLVKKLQKKVMPWDNLKK